MSSAKQHSTRPNDEQLATERAGWKDHLTGPVLHRRTLLGFLVAAPTLMTAVAASASIISPPEAADVQDLGDLQNEFAQPYSGPGFITITINADGTASFDLPRAEVGQGITTSFAMLIADQLKLPLSSVHITLRDADPKLVDNQLTGGSNSTRSLYTPVINAATLAMATMMAVAASKLGVPASQLTAANGAIGTSGGRSISYGELATAAAVSHTRSAEIPAAQAAAATSTPLVGTPVNRIDARDIVMGKKVFTQDLEIPNALPTMICRPPVLEATASAVANMAAVQAMPGITHVAVHPSGVAVRGRTFGQCIDAVRALKVTWTAGSEDATTEPSILTELKAAELPFVPSVGGAAGTLIDNTFTFPFASNSPLETGSAVATVLGSGVTGTCEIWSPLKVPIVTQKNIAAALGFPVQTQVTCHVQTGGGSFGRHLFHDAAMEAAQASQIFGVPVRLMWSRTDDFRQGRTHPYSTSRVQLAYGGGNVLSFSQRHTSVSTDFSHGFGGEADSMISLAPGGNTLALAQTIFETTANVPYDFGPTDQLLNEVDMGFHTGSARNIYSPDVCTAMELTIDQAAAGMKMDPYAFRRAFLKNDPTDPKSTSPRAVATLDAVAKAADWGKAMAPGTAQGIAFHAEYKGVCACVVEIDCTPATVNRVVRDAVTGPRVTRVTFVVDVGLCINPRGLEAQMQGGIMDGIAHALTCSVHFDKGYYAEGSWDNYFYTRQWNVPPQIDVIIMPTTTGIPGGAGEFGVAATRAAVACAYARATGTMPTKLPINHDGPLGFDVLPTVPPTPQSPTNGLATYS